MKKWLRRIRGAVGMGLTWAAGWSVVGTVLWGAGSLLFLDGIFLDGTRVGPATEVAIVPFTFGVVGLVSGAIFSMVLGLAERRLRFAQMSLTRFAAWGAAGGALLSILVLIAESGQIGLSELIFLGVWPLMGAGSAAGSLALARRADDKELLEHGADVADIGLTTEEKRELLA